MADDGEPRTCIRRGQLLTTWRETSGQWRVHIESVKRNGGACVNAEKLMPTGNDRLDAYEYAKEWIERHVSSSL